MARLIRLTLINGKDSAHWLNADKIETMMPYKAAGKDVTRVDYASADSGGMVMQVHVKESPEAIAEMAHEREPLEIRLNDPNNFLRVREA